MSQPSNNSSKKTILLIVSVVVILIIVLGAVKVGKHMMQSSQNAVTGNNSYYASSPAPTNAVVTNPIMTGPTGASTSTSDAQLDKDAQAIDDSLNKLNLEQNNINQGLNNQSQDTPQP